MMARRAAWMNGTATSTEEMMPLNAYAKAQYGNAFGSPPTKAAVPRPCADAAVARPRVIGSLAPTLLRMETAKELPIKPVRTTPTAVTLTISGWPRSVVTGMASATVTDRGTSAAESAEDKPRALPATAVENMAKRDVETRQPKISTA